MKLNNSEKGAITVFLAIILIPSVVVVGTLIDFTRYNTAKQKINGAGELALDAVLANYNSNLKNYYGLFAISNSEDCEKTLRSYFEANIITEVPNNKEYFNIIDLTHLNFNIVDIKNANLANPQALKKQILEVSKYRAPVAYGQKIYEIINSFNSYSVEIDIYDKELKLNEKLALLSIKYQELYMLMVINDNFDTDRFNNYIGKTNSLFYEITDNLMKINYYRKKLKNINFSDDNALEIQETYQNRIAELISSIKKDATKIADYQQEDLMYYGEYIEFLISLQKTCSSIITESENIKRDIEEISDEIQQLQAECNDKTRKDLEQLKDRIKVHANSLIDNDFSIISSYIEPNFGVLQKLISETQKTKYIVYLYGNTYFGDPKSYKLNTLESLSTSKFQNPNSDINITLTEDMRFSENLKIEDLIYYKFYSSFNNQVKAIYQRLYEIYGSALSNAGKNIIEKATKLFSKAIDKKFNNSQSGSKEIPKNIYDSFSSNAVKSYIEPSLNNEIEFSKSIFNNIKTSFVDFSYDMRDKLLINHYLSTMFTCATTQDIDKSQLGYSFSPELNYLYKSEQEYLLFGNRKASTNTLYTHSLLFGLRFTLNYKYAIGCESIRTLVKELAVLGSIVAPLSIPWIEAIILTAVVSAETALDIEQLLNGEGVEVFKTDSSWKLSVINIKKYFEGKTSSIKQTKKDSNEFKMNYQDYLSLLLLTIDSDTLMKRVGNLIELNLSSIHTGNELVEGLVFKTMEAKTAIKLEADTVLNFIFVPLPFITDFINTTKIKGLKITYNNYRGY